jgi:hypothetical protein
MNMAIAIRPERLPVMSGLLSPRSVASGSFKSDALKQVLGRNELDRDGNVTASVPPVPIGQFPYGSEAAVPARPPRRPQCGRQILFDQTHGAVLLPASRRSLRSIARGFEYQPG